MVVNRDCDQERRSGVQLLTATVMVIAFGLGMYSSVPHMRGQYRTGAYSKIEAWPVNEITRKLSADNDGP